MVNKIDNMLLNKIPIFVYAPNDQAHLPLWSASGTAVRWSDLLAKNYHYIIQ
jgi:hypothetical protein